MAVRTTGKRIGRPPLAAALLAVLLALCVFPACSPDRPQPAQGADAQLPDAPDPALTQPPVPLAPARLWLFDAESDTSEPKEFSGFGGAWRIDRRVPSPRYFQSLCHEESGSSAIEPAEQSRARQRRGDFAIADGVYYRNVDLSSYVWIGDDDQDRAGLAFGIRAGDDYYLALLSPKLDRAELVRKSPAKWVSLATGEATIEAGRWQLMRVRAFGERIELYINDKLVANVSAPPDTGMIGLWAEGSARACFDEVAASPS